MREGTELYKYTNVFRSMCYYFLGNQNKLFNKKVPRAPKLSKLLKLIHCLITFFQPPYLQFHLLIESIKYNQSHLVSSCFIAEHHFLRKPLEDLCLRAQSTYQLEVSILLHQKNQTCFNTEMLKPEDNQNTVATLTYNHIPMKQQIIKVKKLLQHIMQKYLGDQTLDQDVPLIKSYLMLKVVSMRLLTWISTVIGPSPSNSSCFLHRTQILTI